MTVPGGIFATLPENFFSPLARANRRHYAALLILYYRLFQENSGRLERELVMRSFTEYLGRNRDSLMEDDEDAQDIRGETDTRTLPLDFGAEEPAAAVQNDRALAGRFLRRLTATGWLGEETLGDYTRVVNISPYSRPFFEALARVEEGLKTEYESHVVAVYSLLCTDAVQDNGHYAVLNAHTATIALIDSLKVLSQSIKAHYDRFTAQAAEGDIRSILHLHYDVYANDILDGAYKRLKTSDNLSRYRPRIIKKVGELIRNESWLTESARKYARLGSASMTLGESRQRLLAMLEEIRDTLRAVDPLLEDIDRRNMLYARSSIERVKTLLEPDSTIAGKLSQLVRAIHDFKEDDQCGAAPHDALIHRLHRVQPLKPESLYRRQKREAVRLKGERLSASSREARMKAEEELMERLRRQLSPGKIGLWLDSLGGEDRPLPARELVRDEDSFGRFVYSLLYADSRPRSFDYRIEDAGGMVETGDYAVPDVALRRKHEKRS
ncbi:MAG: DUF5716 family protein [Treponema sp.]|jgi:hypothetical protein|nr:DUF5716 family protein [Treponema sp.]